MWATSVIFNELSRVNNHPSGEFSPNLVTLLRVLPLNGTKQKPHLSVGTRKSCRQKVKVDVYCLLTFERSKRWQQFSGLIIIDI
jgi:hypothetical protein